LWIVKFGVCCAMDGTLDCATTAIAAVKPCAFGAPLRGCGA